MYKAACSNYRRISLLPTKYRIWSNILLPKLTPYVEEIIGDHQCWFCCDRSDILHSSDTGEKLGI
jgi:hypothetical protein